ncbi:MAG: hypothetical protein KatS3mg111_4326 [Pirellulaceae bacterium]|nr:MAG: hypothetical protein KatS3mg111_4326 [Pirellulaceae bacterium]
MNARRGAYNESNVVLAGNRECPWRLGVIVDEPTVAKLLRLVVALKSFGN